MTQVLFRESLAEDGEAAICAEYFNVVTRRRDLQPNLVIGRYSVLPYYRELEDDIDGKLINSYAQHRWIANFDYYDAVRPYTPETWDESNFYSCNHPGPFVVKGKTNSKKFHWNETMFATDKRAAMHVACKLHEDMYLGDQGVIFRKYCPLRTYETGLYGLPFANEWRVFCYRENILSRGYYWSCASDDAKAMATWGGESLVKTLMPIVSKHVNFYVLDVAETIDGDWILIEINDGQMSGLSENDPNILYSNLARYV